MGRLVLASLAIAALVLGNVALGSPGIAGSRLGEFRVSVEIDGIGTAQFKSVSGLTFDVNVVEYREGTNNEIIRKVPGAAKWSNIELKQGFSGDPSALMKWAFRIAGGANERHSGRILLYDEKLRLLSSWTFANGFPVKWEGPDFDASSNELAIETIEIAHEGLRFEPRQDPPPSPTPTSP